MAQVRYVQASNLVGDSCVAQRPPAALRLLGRRRRARRACAAARACALQGASRLLGRAAPHLLRDSLGDALHGAVDVGGQEVGLQQARTLRGGAGGGREGWGPCRLAAMGRGPGSRAAAPGGAAQVLLLPPLPQAWWPRLTGLSSVSLPPKPPEKHRKGYETGPESACLSLPHPWPSTNTPDLHNHTTHVPRAAHCLRRAAA